MVEYIERQKLIAACEKKHIAISANEHPYDAVRTIGRYFKQCVDEAPAADVAPRSELAREIFEELERANVVRLTEDYWRIKEKHAEGKNGR